MACIQHAGTIRVVLRVVYSVGGKVGLKVVVWNGGFVVKDDESLASVKQSEDDPVNPAHYRNLVPEPIDVIDGWGLGFHLGTVVKYISRAGHKPGNSTLQDLEKAAWYLARKIQKLKKENAK